jgi:two-component system, chemotaxis family, protein-glutamate methylesterase/glutaminase
MTSVTPAAPRPKIRVLIVDDSALARSILTQVLGGDPEIEVVGTAQDAYAAREQIKRLNPDVLTLDVEMPRMDGLQFLRNLMRLRPMPVVMCSSLTAQGADVTLESLSLGAIDFVTKPRLDLAYRIDEYASELITKVKVAAHARVRPLNDALASTTRLLSAEAMLAKANAPRHFKTSEQIIAIGASTGGTEAIKEVLMRLRPDSPGVVITQHIPKAFSGPFAARMNSCSPLQVCEATDGQQILPGHAYIAPGDQHLLVARDGARYCCRLDGGAPVNRHKPSVDVLFRSVAQNVGHNAIAVILTGMGRDGSQGMREMRLAGAACIGQDENTSVVWGMPGAAWEAGAVESLHPVESIGPRIMELAAERSVTRRTGHG